MSTDVGEAEKAVRADEEYRYADHQSIQGEQGEQEESREESGNSKQSHSPHGEEAREATGSDSPTKQRKTFAEMAKQRRRPSVPDFLRPDPNPKLAKTGSKVKAFLAQELNFYRVHLVIFTLTPLIFSAIFYASNTTPISYIDCLFVCVSAMTVTGLSTINISIITNWQQAILFFLMAIGNLSAVSVTMVLIRRHFFRLKFDDVIKRSAKARKRMKDVEDAHQKEKRKELIRLQRMVGLRRKHAKEGGSDETTPSEGSPRSSSSTDQIAEAELKAERLAKKKERSRKKQQGPLRADMIRRMDEPAVLINPAGMPSRALSDGGGGEQGRSPTSGGILSNQEDAERGEGDPNHTPDIRFALPRRSVSEIRRASDGMMVQTPDEIGSDPMHLHPLPPRRRSVNQELAGERDQERGERETSQSTTRSAEPMRTRFEGEGSVAAAWHSRDRSGSDPPTRAAKNLHLRSGSDAGALRLTGGSSKPAVDMFPRTQTIEFSEPMRERDKRLPDRSARSSAVPLSGEPGLRHRTNTLDMERTPTAATNRSYSRRPTGIPLTRTQTTAKERGFGGFPTPIEIAGHVVQRAFPKFQEKMTRTMTIPHSATFASTHSFGGAGESTAISTPYLSFDATVSRNSRFQELTEAQKDELGGVEYRAIDLLSKIIPAYWFLFNFFFITLVAPWLSSRGAAKVHDVLASQGQTAPNTTWMWFFQVISAYSNTGLSLIDTSMIQLGDQYFMLIPIAILILAGNTAFPIFLRFFIWIISLIAPSGGRLYETLRFLLDHPRRCFVYLFPSSQTWFLLAVLCILNSIDWVFFQILDIGNDTIEGWSTGQRIFDGLFQSVAVRAAGFQIISILTLAPAVQFLYIVMMYISAYPIAMSVRNTNVYEERSLGVYTEAPGDTEEPESGNARVWGTYLAAHARRQLAFDIWWLGFALWLICIIEKSNIENPDSNGWFTVFSCLFELTSAYGTVGLSTGTPYDNFSLSGRFSTLGKLVVIVVMLRGRHRGLPVAIDRAVLLPGELEAEDEYNGGLTQDEDAFLRSRSFAPTSSANNLFPRTPTGLSAPGTPHVQRGMREKSPPSLDIDGTEVDPLSRSANDEDSGVHTTPDLQHHYPHLAAIREATPSPSATPTPMSRTVSHSMQKEREAKLGGRGNSDSSLDSSSSVKRMGRQEQGPQYLGGLRVEQLPSVVDSSRSEENDEEEERRLSAVEEQFRERYGSGP